MRSELLRHTAAICLALACLITSGCIADTGGEETESEQRLVVERNELELEPYTNEEKQNVTSALTEAFCRAVYDIDQTVVPMKKRAEIMTFISDKIVPLLEANVSFEQLESSDLMNFEISDIEGASNAYLKGLLCLGDEAAGNIAYELSLLYFREKEITNREKYEKYGSRWYLDDAERYSSYQRDLSEDVTREEFVLMLNMLSLCSTTLNGSGAFEPESIRDEDKGALLLTFLGRQSAQLEGGISPESAAAMLKMIFEITFSDFEPGAEASRLFAEEWYALGNEGEFAYQVGLAAGEFSRLYSAFAREITPQEAQAILSCEKDERMVIICGVIGRCESEFIAFAERIALCRLEGDGEREAIEESGCWAEFEAYRAERSDITAKELFDRISEENVDISAVESACRDFAFGIAPYATYVFYEVGK